MPGSRCYLDYNATAPLRDSALRACVEALQVTGNPSSIHAEGRAVRSIVEAARRAVGALVGAAADRVVFTSGGTEGANFVLTPDLRSYRVPDGPSRLLISATEHAAVRHGHRFAEYVTDLPVRPDGVIDLDRLAEALAADGGSPALVVLQAANNETGVIQPVAEAAAMVHAHDGLIVCDAIQAVGRIPVDLGEIGADVLLLSGHKIGGPQGTGAVVFAPGVSVATSFVRGGGQERGSRSGTENVSGIAGFGAAALDVAGCEDAERLQAMRGTLEAAVRDIDDEIVVFGEGAPRLPNTSCFAVPGLDAGTALIAMDLKGFAISSGSACSSGKVSRSHVLEAMGVPRHLSSGALRVSSGFRSQPADIHRFVEAFGAVMHRMQRRSVRTAA